MPIDLAIADKLYNFPHSRATRIRRSRKPHNNATRVEYLLAFVAEQNLVGISAVMLVALYMAA